MVWNRSSVMVCGVLMCVCCTGALAYPVGSNGWHLNSAFQMKANADMVCKVHIRDVRDIGMVPFQLFPGAPEVHRRIAVAEVVSVIKGSCPASIEIEHQFPAGNDPAWGFPTCQLFTELRAGESCLVFLKGSGAPYSLNRIQSKARVVASPVAYDLEDEPLLKLLAEFLAGLSCNDEMICLQSAQELGHIGDELMGHVQPFEGDDGRSRRIADAIKRARSAIQAMRSSQDFVIRSAAIISSFQLADPPALDETLQILPTDANSFGPAASEAKYGIRGFCVSDVQNRLLATMDATTRRFIRNLDDGSMIEAPGGRHGPYRGTPGFPYARFFRAALATDVVARSADMRKAIANVIWIRYEKASVPEMIRLLDDPVIHIRGTAVSALNQCVNGNFSNEWDRRTFYQMDQVSGQSDRKPLEQRLQDYERNEREYIQHWKAWWAEHRGEFEGVDGGGAAMLSQGMEY